MSTWPKGWSWEVHLSKGQTDSKCDQISSWPKGWSWEVHLTKGQPDSKCDQMSTWSKAWSWEVQLTKGQTDSKCDQMLAWPKAWWLGVCLSKGQPDSKCDQMSTRPKASWWGMSDQRSAWPEDLTKCQPDLKPHLLKVLLTKWKKDIWKFQHTLHFRSCFTEVFSIKPKVCIYPCVCVCVSRLNVGSIGQ